MKPLRVGGGERKKKGTDFSRKIALGASDIIP